MLPQFLGDERHEWMYDVQKLVEDIECSLECSLVDRSLVCRLYHLKVPARELISEQLEGCHESLIEAILRIVVVDFCIYSLYLCIHPCYGLLVWFRLLYVGYLPALYEAEGIPHLVTEVHTLCTQCVIVQNVVAGRSRKHHTHAYAVSAILLYQLEWVRRVAQ